MTTLARNVIEQNVDLAQVEALIGEWKLELLLMAERVTAELNEQRFEVTESAADLCHVSWSQDLGPRFADALATLEKMQALWKAHMKRTQKGHPASSATDDDIYLQQVGARDL